MISKECQALSDRFLLLRLIIHLEAKIKIMFNIRQLTTGAVVGITLAIAAASTQAFVPTNSIPSRALTQNLQQDSQIPDSVPQQYREDTAKRNTPRPRRQLSVSGISGRSTKSRMPGNIPRNPDGTEQRIEPVITPCPIPIVVLNRAGRKVTRIQPDKEGYFRVSLKPGTYTLVSEIEKSNYLVLGNTRNELQNIKVTGGKFTTINLTYTELIP